MVPLAEHITAGEQYDLQFKVKNGESNYFAGGTLYVKISYEANRTWSIKTLPMPRIEANTETVIPESPLKLIAFSDGPVMFYGAIESSDGSAWDLIGWEGERCLQYSVVKSSNRLALNGEVTAFGHAFSEKKADVWVRYTFYGTLAIILLTLLLIFLTIRR